MARTQSKDFIMSQVNAHYNETLSTCPPDQIVAVCLFGSQNYNLDTETSDIDVKLITLPDLNDIIFLHDIDSYTHERENGSHTDVRDLRLLMKSFQKQNPNMLEILFTKYSIVNPAYMDEWKKLLVNGEKIARYDPVKAMKAMLGMVTSRCNILEHRYDSKALSHILRVEEMMEKYSMGEDYAKCLIPNDCDDLLSVKKGLEFTPEEGKLVARDALIYCKELADKFIATHSPSKVDAQVEELLKEVQYNIMEKHLRRYFK